MKIPEILMVETVHQPGSLVKVLQVIADAGLAIEHLTTLRRDQGRTLWEITLEMDEEADRSLYERIGQLPTARFVGKSDRVFNRHRGGKIRTVASLPINTRQVLRDVYTPGVARVCLAIQKDAQAALDFTALGRTVAIITNGTAVLGLGNIGALARLPVMEGKAALFAGPVGINGVPIPLEETQPAGGEGVTLESLMQRADIVIATTGVKGLIRPQWVRKGQVILALSNPDPEIEPLVAHEQGAAFAADGKGINNLLAFPGLFKGALEARARRFSDAMLMAAADTIAALARGDELVPDPLDKALHEQVAAAVRAAAQPPAAPD